MDFDSTQVKHYYQWCFTREEGPPPAIIADLWLHLFTRFTKKLRHRILLYFSFAGSDFDTR